MKYSGKPNRLVALMAMVLFVYGLPANAQHGDMSGHDMHQQMQNMPHNGMQQMNQQNMQMSMDQMMKQMNEMLSHTGEVVKIMKEQEEHMHDGMRGDMSGQGGINMAAMGKNLDVMARGMRKTLMEMQKIMSDQKMMNDPAMKKRMEDMQGGMGDMMVAMEGLMKSLEKIHSQKNSE